MWPSEFLNEATATQSQLKTAQATVRVYLNLGNGRPVLTFPSAVAAGTGVTGMSYTPEDVIKGLNAHMDDNFGPNLLTHCQV